MLGCPHILAHKNDVEIGAVSDFAAAKFSERDNREIAFASAQPIDENQAGFRQGRVLGKNRGQIGKPEDVPKKNSEQLRLPIDAKQIERFGPDIQRFEALEMLL